MTALVLLLLALHQLLGRSYSFFFLFYAPQLRVDGQEKLSLTRCLSISNSLSSRPDGLSDEREKKWKMTGGQGKETEALESDHLRSHHHFLSTLGSSFT